MDGLTGTKLHRPVHSQYAPARDLQLLGKEAASATPHFVGQNVPRIRFDEVAELSRCLLPRIGSLDAFNSLLGMFDRTALVRFAKIQMQRARRDQTGNVRRVTIL